MYCSIRMDLLAQKLFAQHPHVVARCNRAKYSTNRTMKGLHLLQMIHDMDACIYSSSQSSCVLHSCKSICIWMPRKSECVDKTGKLSCGKCI